MKFLKWIVWYHVFDARSTNLTIEMDGCKFSTDGIFQVFLFIYSVIGTNSDCLSKTIIPELPALRMRTWNFKASGKLRQWKTQHVLGCCETRSHG